MHVHLTDVYVITAERKRLNIQQRKENAKKAVATITAEPRETQCF